MSYAIVGFGKIGHALAKAFARKGIEVSVATQKSTSSGYPSLHWNPVHLMSSSSTGFSEVA
jgi:3-hydroxyisobutyrate dehydrogenase-like beta-hydroxyacid dehydrogenase